MTKMILKCVLFHLIIRERKAQLQLLQVLTDLIHRILLNRLFKALIRQNYLKKL